MKKLNNKSLFLNRLIFSTPSEKAKSKTKGYPLQNFLENVENIQSSCGYLELR